MGGRGHSHAAGLMWMAVEAAVFEIGIHDVAGGAAADWWNGDGV